MSPENPNPEMLETYADLEVARNFGYSKMGERYFDDFVSQFLEKDLAIKIINGRLATRTNNVHVLASVNRAEELALVQAAVLQALDNEELCLATILTNSLGKPDLDTSMAFSLMKGRAFFGDQVEENLLDYNSGLSKSMLLVSTPDALSEELSMSQFGYRWPVELNLEYQHWKVGDIEVITKM
jgi:hypothetical protein